MLSTYRAVFRAPGSAAFTAAGFVMEMPIAIYPIGLVLIISARAGHYGFAGVASGLFVAGSVPGAPLLSRLVDRYGQSRIIVPSSVVHIAAVLTVALLISAGAPDWSLTAPIVVAGFTYISVGSLVRARWSSVLGGGPQLSTAYSLASVLDEAIFVLGPMLATLLATLTNPVVILYVAAVLVAAGGTSLTMQRRTEPTVTHDPSVPHRSPLRERGMVPTLLATVFMGATFASAEVSEVAYCGQHGQRNIGGLVVAMWAFGSGVSGFLYGARQHAAGPITRFRIQGIVFGVLPLLFLVVPNVPVLAVIAFVAGSGTAPVLITAFAVVERLVPPIALTEGLTWVSVGLSVGFGGAAAVVGGIADAHGARISFLVAVGSALAAGVTAILVHRMLTRAPDGDSHTLVATSKSAPLP